MKKRILSVLLVAVMLFALEVCAFAYPKMPDLTQDGSLTFTMNFDGEPLDSGNLKLYRVGDIKNIQYNTYDFALVEALQSYAIDISDPADPDAASALLAAAQAQNLTVLSAPISEGKAVFTDLKTGLYLVWQAKADAVSGFAPIQPFLISVPRLQNDQFELDVVSAPKVPLETKPDEPPPPPPPPPPNLPPTGQLNWPIPLMAAAGAVLFIIGLVLCTCKKRSAGEK